jgi:hypothetical protein
MWRPVGTSLIQRGGRATLTEKPRQFRFDIAFPEHKIAIEYNGGTYSRGRHNRPMGHIRDCTKTNMATLDGWRVLSYTVEHVKNNRVYLIPDEVKRLMKATDGRTDADRAGARASDDRAGDRELQGHAEGRARNARGKDRSDQNGDPVRASRSLQPIRPGLSRIVASQPEDIQRSRLLDEASKLVSAILLDLRQIRHLGADHEIQEAIRHVTVTAKLLSDNRRAVGDPA